MLTPTLKQIDRLIEQLQHLEKAEDIFLSVDIRALIAINLRRLRDLRDALYDRDEYTAQKVMHDFLEEQDAIRTFEGKK